MKRMPTLFSALLTLFFQPTTSLLALPISQNGTFSELNVDVSLSIDTNDIPVQRPLLPPPPPPPPKNGNPSNEKTQEEYETGSEVLSFAQEMPFFTGGDSGIQKFLSDQLEYPKKAKELCFEGKIYVEMIVEKDASTTNHKIIRNGSGSEELGEEALRVCKLLKFESPGKQFGKPVRIRLAIPISFKISKYGSGKNSWEYKGGASALEKFVEENLVYPEKELSKDQRATYIVIQTLDYKGNVKKNEVVFENGKASKEFEKEANRLAELITKYECTGGTDCDLDAYKHIYIRFDENAIEKAKKK